MKNDILTNQGQNPCQQDQTDGPYIFYNKGLYYTNYIIPERQEVYQTKKILDVPMSYSGCLKLYHVWVRGDEGWDQGIGWGQQHGGNGAAKLQHGTGVEVSLHPCREGHHTK
jgi:hypothetical protein